RSEVVVLPDRPCPRRPQRAASGRLRPRAVLPVGLASETGLVYFKRPSRDIHAADLSAAGPDGPRAALLLDPDSRPTPESGHVPGRRSGRSLDQGSLARLWSF